MQDWNNIILLTLDALRADHLSAYSYHRETSPVLSEFADKGISFTSAYSASSHTREAVPSLLTGCPPANAVDSNYCLAPNTDTLATRLSDKGFTTAAFHSNPFLSRAYGFDRGFDTFDDDFYLGRHRIIALLQRAMDKLRNRHYARAEEINNRALAWIDSLEAKTPFFLWNHYMDTHGPYEPPAEYRSLYRDNVPSNRNAQRLYQRAIDDPDSITSDDRQQLIDLYDSEIQYTDAQIGAFLDALRERNLLDDSLIILTADHGDAFGEHGYYEHPRYLHTELIHVPLFVYHSGVSSSTIQVPVSTVDIAATVMSAVGDEPFCPLGQDLLTIAATPSNFEDRIVYSSARQEGDDSHLRRLSARSTAETWFSTYNHAQAEVLDNDHNSTNLLKEYIDQYIPSNNIVSTEDPNISDSIEDRLAALGYK
ncbi:arylsulfatase [Halonotius terrestris]|uniref:Arylsulfatase n=1 Tax=Halonotius terrestris TaxID=2487750 RepID=A0A8J8TDJ6_9EURY|nr:sulfatase [Halonotius terrestris]TQQ83367.1 arylsulfatase [Halonotius terrestris]